MSPATLYGRSFRVTHGDATSNGAICEAQVEAIQAKSESWNVRLVAHNDLNGHGDGMQLLKNGRYVYLAHLGTSPMALTILDASDPADPQVVRQMPHPNNTHAHKVQIAGDILIQNQERPYFDKSISASVPNEAGIRIYSIANPTEPREIGYMKIPGKGVHRMWFTDGKYAHVGAMIPGIKERAYLIADLSDPSNPKQAGVWWIPGTKEGEETPPDWTPFPGEHFHVHGAIPHGDRSYVALGGCGHGHRRHFRCQQTENHQPPRLESALRRLRSHDLAASRKKARGGRR